MKDALDSWTESFSAASKTSLEASQKQELNDNDFKKQSLQLREEAGELESLTLLFNGTDEESEQYRNAERGVKTKEYVG